LRGEPEAGAVPRSGAADPTSRNSVKANAKIATGQHHHDQSQGKITEYFKTQIKPQQAKVRARARLLGNPLTDVSEMNNGRVKMGDSKSCAFTGKT